MPHVIIKHFPTSISENILKDFSLRIQDLILDYFPTEPSSVSVHCIPIPEDDWRSEVIEKDLLPNRNKLILEPGYLD